MFYQKNNQSEGVILKNLKSLLVYCVLPVLLVACAVSFTAFASSAADNKQFLFTSSTAVSNITGAHNATATYNSTEKCAQLTASSAADDPYVSFSVETVSSTAVSADTYKYIVLTYKCPTTNSSVSSKTQIFLCAGSVTSAAEASSYTFDNTKNGTYVYTVIDLSGASYWNGTVHSLRIDFFSSCQANDTMFLDSITFCSTSSAATTAGTYRAGRANGLIAAENYSLVFDDASKLSYVQIEESAALAGDVNGDNTVNTLDSFMLRRLLAGLGSPTSIADINGDGHLSARDSLMLRKYLADQISSLPAAKATSAVKEYDSGTEAVKLTSMSTNPIIYINLADEGISATDLKYAAITYMTPASSAAGQSRLAFVPAGAAASSCAKNTVTLTRDGKFHNAVIDLSAVSGWTGGADGISIELFTACNIGDIYSIDSIILAETLEEANSLSYQRYLDANNIPLTTVEKLDVSAQTLGRINTASSKANFGYWALGTAQAGDYLMPYSTTWSAAGYTASASRDTLMAFVNYDNYVKVADCIDLSKYSSVTITYGTDRSFAAYTSEFGFFSAPTAYGHQTSKNTSGLIFSAALTAPPTGSWTATRTVTANVNSSYCGPLYMSLYMADGNGAAVTDVTFTLKEPESTVVTDPVNNVEGTPEYTVSGDGNYIIANGVTYPNKLNYTSGATVGTDDLDRKLSTTASSDVPTFTLDNGDVGIFYFLCLGQHGDVNGQVYDISKILATGGEAAKSVNYSGWGPVGYHHFFYEPLYGYYYSSDLWVIRKHVEELINANIDFLYFDTTNSYSYPENALKVMSVLHDYNARGYDAPKVVFYTNTSAASTVQDIYNNIYSKNRYPDTWYCLEGKPVIVSLEATCKASLPSAVYNYFTFRESQWPTESAKTNGWPWLLDFATNKQKVYFNDSGNKETISVGCASHCGSITCSLPAIYGMYNTDSWADPDHGRSWHNGGVNGGNGQNVTADSYKYGYNFQEQWDYAISQDAPIVLVTGWNEWIAARFTASAPGIERVLFVDTCSLEYSRDLEMTRGGYFDNYYMQLINNVRRYKGSAPTLIHTAKKRIDTTGSFTQWNDVTAIYRDGLGETTARYNLGYGMRTLTNSTGRNDLNNGKIIHDTEYLYFYIDTQSTISTYNTDSSWMQLYIDVDSNANTGWYGYDYIANYDAKTDRITSLAQSQSDTSYSYTEVCELNYKVVGNMLMLKVPLASLGITDADNIDIQFKWADSTTSITSMEQMYTDGDTMPHGRPNYEYKVG